MTPCLVLVSVVVGVVVVVVVVVGVVGVAGFFDEEAAALEYDGDGDAGLTLGVGSRGDNDVSAATPDLRETASCSLSCELLMLVCLLLFAVAVVAVIAVVVFIAWMHVLLPTALTASLSDLCLGVDDVSLRCCFGCRDNEDVWDENIGAAPFPSFELVTDSVATCSCIAASDNFWCFLFLLRRFSEIVVAATADACDDEADNGRAGITCGPDFGASNGDDGIVGATDTVVPNTGWFACVTEEEGAAPFVLFLLPLVLLLEHFLGAVIEEEEEESRGEFVK